MCVNEGALALGVPTCGSEPSAAVLGMAVPYWSAGPVTHLKEAVLTPVHCSVSWPPCLYLCLTPKSVGQLPSGPEGDGCFCPIALATEALCILGKTGRSQLECGDIVMNVPGLAPQQSTPPQTPGGSAKEDSPIAAQRFLLLCWAGRFVPSHQLSPYVSDHMSLSGSARHSWSMLLAGRGSAACVLCLWPQAH